MRLWDALAGFRVVVSRGVLASRRRSFKKNRASAIDQSREQNSLHPIMSVQQK